MSAGIRMAFGDARDRAGSIPVRLVTLDSTRGRGEPWDPGQVLANAERAKDDSSAIAYIGELDLGASAISLPETNEADLLQVSPYDGLTSLTRSPPGRAGRGAPVSATTRTAHRSFVRLVPNDLREADTMLGRLSRPRRATRVPSSPARASTPRSWRHSSPSGSGAPAAPSWPRRRCRGGPRLGRVRGGRSGGGAPGRRRLLGHRRSSRQRAPCRARDAPRGARARHRGDARAPAVDLRAPPRPRSRRSARSGRPTGTAAGGARCSRGCAAAAMRPRPGPRRCTATRPRASS